MPAASTLSLSNSMSAISLIFNEVLYRPLFNGLIFLYNIIPFHDFGLAIILLTIIIRLILYPLNQKAIISQKAIGELQPQIKDLQNKFKDDKVKQSQALMELYKQKGVNPASGCLPILIQLPILIALYQVLLAGLDPSKLDILYPFISRPASVNPIFFGLLDLGKSNYWLAILAGLFTFIQTKMMVKKSSAAANDFASAMNKQMVYFMPAITLFIAWRLPAGLALYWVVMTLLGIGQQYLIIKKNGHGKG